MHPAWQIDDIRQLIFERLSPQDLARLAQTCKFLFDIATNELWKTITSFSSFLSCLPPDFQSRPLEKEDIQRLDFYASKVRNLVLESKINQRVIRLPAQFQYRKKYNKKWEELWKEIEKLRPTSEFLPNLHRLRISNVAEELLIPLVGISAANLIQIYIKYIQNRQSSSIVQKILDQLQYTPKLEYLFVRDGGPDLIPSRLIKQSPVLKHLRLDPRLHAGKHEDYQFKEFPLRIEILQKSTLENLTFGLTQGWYTPEIEEFLKGGKYLPKLKTLWLNLTTFPPSRCRSSCINASSHSWTCMSDNDGISSKLSNLNLNDSVATDCGRRSPSFFLEGLDNPELSLLNIKFPLQTTGPLFLDVVSTANKTCRLQKLSELALAGGGWVENCAECGSRPRPLIKPAELREGLNLLLPLPYLKLLRLSVAPNFLDILDLDLYKSITDGLPALEKLWLGHGEFLTTSQFEGTTYYERVPLHHLAAFCSLLPNLVEVSMGTVDGLTLEENPREEWTCPGVKSLRIHFWAGRETSGSVSKDLLLKGLRTYFPNSDLAKDESHSRLYFD